MEKLDHADYRVWLHCLGPTALFREGEKPSELYSTLLFAALSITPLPLGRYVKVFDAITL